MNSKSERDACTAIYTKCLPIPLMLPCGTIWRVRIPQMDEATFEFFKNQLEQYKSYIISAPKPSGVPHAPTP